MYSTDEDDDNSNDNDKKTTVLRCECGVFTTTISYQNHINSKNHKNRMEVINGLVKYDIDKTEYTNKFK